MLNLLLQVHNAVNIFCREVDTLLVLVPVYIGTHFPSPRSLWLFPTLSVAAWPGGLDFRVPLKIINKDIINMMFFWTMAKLDRQ